MERFFDTLLSQYSVSPTLVQLIRNANEWIDPRVDIDNFYRQIWNVDTAEGHGLNLWGRIVAVGRVLQVSFDKYFGFEEMGVLDADPFNQSPFYNGQRLNNNFVLSDDGFRTLIIAKAFANICDGSIPSINFILSYLFDPTGVRGGCYVIDGLDMSMKYHFRFTPTPVEASIITTSGVLPKPTGVSVTVEIA